MAGLPENSAMGWRELQEDLIDYLPGQLQQRHLVKRGLWTSPDVIAADDKPVWVA